MPSVVEALQITRVLLEPQGPFIHHFPLVSPEQISPSTFLASVDRTGSQVALRISFPEPDIHSPAYFSSSVEHLGEGGGRVKCKEKGNRELLFYRSAFLLQWKYIHPHISLGILPICFSRKIIFFLSLSIFC